MHRNHTVFGEEHGPETITTSDLNGRPDHSLVSLEAPNLPSPTSLGSAPLPIKTYQGLPTSNRHLPFYRLSNATTSRCSPPPLLSIEEVVSLAEEPDVPLLDTTRERIVEFDSGHEQVFNPYIASSFRAFSDRDMIASQMLASTSIPAGLPTLASRLDSLTGSQTFKTARSSFASYATAASGPSNLQRSFQRAAANLALAKHTVFSSEWLRHLEARGVIQSPEEALDWSGRGQHVEYLPEEEASIPLISKGSLGHGASGFVDRVRCRRIDLARKTIRCNRRLTKKRL